MSESAVQEGAGVRRLIGWKSQVQVCGCLGKEFQGHEKWLFYMWVGARGVGLSPDGGATVVNRLLTAVNGNSYSPPNGQWDGMGWDEMVAKAQLNLPNTTTAKAKRQRCGTQWTGRAGERGLRRAYQMREMNKLMSPPTLLFLS